jgi:hypothetical protein
LTGTATARTTAAYAKTNAVAAMHSQTTAYPQGPPCSTGKWGTAADTKTQNTPKEDRYVKPTKREIPRAEPKSMNRLQQFGDGEGKGESAHHLTEAEVDRIGLGGIITAESERLNAQARPQTIRRSSNVRHERSQP